MNTPDREECFRLIHKMDMMDHIIDHSIMVSNVAQFICSKLLPHSPNLNLELTTTAALLHDITKTRSFETDEVHSETGGDLLTNLGYPEMGNIVRQHVVLDDYESKLQVSEQEIVNYSDKRVLHDTIVSLEKRLEYIKIKYGQNIEFKERIQSMRTNSFCLEKKIFGILKVPPDQLPDLITMNIKKEDFTE